jgi:hypothetical protein
VLASLAAAAVGWEDAAAEALARAEYAEDGTDPELIEEAQDKLDEGGPAARTFLLDTVAPAALHDRLHQPI